MERTISHSFATLTHEILFLSREHKIHIFLSPCNILYSGSTKTYFQLSGTERNLVCTCKPLTWLVRGTSTFFITKKKYRNSWKLTSNYSTIKIYFIVIKVNLALDKTRLNIPFQLHRFVAISFVSMCFIWLILIAGLSHTQFTRVNIICL